jgi:hypothetical protein
MSLPRLLAAPSRGITHLKALRDSKRSRIVKREVDQRGKPALRSHFTQFETNGHRLFNE